MLARRFDLPTERDALARFLPWIIAFMVYLAVLALAGMLALSASARHWDRGVSGTLTVQIAPAAGSGVAAEADRRNLERALEILRATPGVASAKPVADEDIVALLRPWLGDEGIVGDLPLPRLIDVRMVAGTRIDAAALNRRLAAVVPGTSVDDHRTWLDRLIRFIRTVEAVAFMVLILIGLTTIGTVIFTTRTGLAVHQDAIEVLHLIGAHDSYIARQFAARAMALGVRGGGIGLLFAVPTVWGIGTLASGMEAALLPAVRWSAAHWVAMGAIPVAVVAIAMLTAWLTVLRTLRRMI